MISRRTQGSSNRPAGRDDSSELAVDTAGLDAKTALLASGHAFAVTDAREPDDPLVWVNPAFERLTGYRSADVLGRNCRLLQGPATDSSATDRIRDALRAGEAVTATMLNYRRDGTTWWNQVTITPVRDESGGLTHFVGVQSDVSDRVVADEQRDDARADAATAHDRLALLAEAGAMLAGTPDPGEAARRLTTLLVPAIADWASVRIVGATGAPSAPLPVLTLTHRDPGLADMVERILSHSAREAPAGSPQAEVLRTGRPVLIARVEDAPDFAGNEQVAADWHDLGAHSCVVVPLLTRNERIGSLTLAYSTSARTYCAADVEFATDLGRRAGTALETADRYATEHDTALALQRSLLPVLPHVEGMELAARYLPGSDRAEIGGDWYDVLPLPDGATGIAVGDVMGHDIGAAAAMGQLRSVLRSYAWEGHGPAGVLDRLNQLVCGLGMAQLATCIYARIEPGAAGRPALLRWANAGHPPPLLRTPDGEVHVLTDGAGTLIGVNLSASALGERSSACRDLPPGSTLLFYTDGLIEDRDRDIDDGIEILRNAFATAAPCLSMDDLADRITAAAGHSQQDDDQCLLLVHLS